ncbi:MAG: FliM/FliN family flagellar motor switch protein [Microthrixaceae bacterium]
MEATRNDGRASGTVFDSTAAARLTAEQLDAIRDVLAPVATPLCAVWSSLSSTEVGIRLVGVTRTVVPEADPDSTDPLVPGALGEAPFVAVADIRPGLGLVVASVPAALGLVAVDLLLGGSGRPTANRTFSEIDLDLLSAIAAPTFSALAQATSRPTDASEPLISTVVVDQDTDLAERMGSAFTAEFEATVGEATYPLYLTVSRSGAEYLLRGVAVEAADSELTDHLRDRFVRNVPLEAVVAFPAISLPSHRLLALAVGDVIGLRHGIGRPLALTVDGIRVAEVRPARAGDEVACQVLTTVIGDDESQAPEPASSITPTTPGGVQ